MEDETLPVHVYGHVPLIRTALFVHVLQFAYTRVTALFIAVFVFVLPCVDVYCGGNDRNVIAICTGAGHAIIPHIWLHARVWFRGCLVEIIGGKQCIKDEG